MSNNQLNITLGLTRSFLIGIFRNKGGFIFGLIFPIIFVAIFGLFGAGDQQIKIGVADELNRSEPLYQTLKSLSEKDNSPVELVEGSVEELEKQVNKSQLAGILTSGKSAFILDRPLTLITSNANPQGKAQAESLLKGVADQMNLQAAGITSPTFSFQSKEISGRPYKYIDFALPGQVGFSMLGLATFGIAFAMLTLRRTLVLKRMFATQVKPLSFVLAQVLSRSVQAIIQSAIIIAIGVWAFDFTLLNGWVSFFEMLVVSVLGVMSFLGFGLLLSNLAKDEQSLPIVLNLFNLPQILLAGVFFPIDGLPKWLQYIGHNLPLAYLNDGLRKLSVEGAHIWTIWPYLLGMLAWGAVAYILSARTFQADRT